MAQLGYHKLITSKHHLKYAFALGTQAHEDIVCISVSTPMK